MRRDFEGEEAGRKEVQGKSVDEEGAGGAFHSSASGYKVYLCTYRLALFELLGEETRACSNLSGPPLEVHWCCYPFAPQKPFVRPTLHRKDTRCLELLAKRICRRLVVQHQSSVYCFSYLDT